MSEQKGSVRQLPPGKLNNIKKIFEDGDNNSASKSDKPMPPARPVQPPSRAKSPVRQHAPRLQSQAQPNSKSLAANQQQQQVTLAPQTTEHVLLNKDQGLAGRQQCSDAAKFSSSHSLASDQAQQGKDVKKLNPSVIGKFSTPSDNNTSAQNFISDKSISTASTATPPKPAFRHTRGNSNGGDTVILDNPLYSSTQQQAKTAQDISDLYAKVNKPKKDADGFPRKVSFTPEDKVVTNIVRREAVRKNSTERRKTIAGGETDTDDVGSNSVNVAERLKLFGAAKGGKPSLPQKPDSVSRKFSMRTQKEFDEQQQRRSQIVSTNGSQVDSLYDPPWDMSKSNVLEKLKKSQPSPALLSAKSDSHSPASKLGPPPKPPVSGVAVKHPDVPTQKSAIEEHILRNQPKAHPAESSAESSPHRVMTSAPPKPPASGVAVKHPDIPTQKSTVEEHILRNQLKAHPAESSAESSPHRVMTSAPPKPPASGVAVKHADIPTQKSTVEEHILRNQPKAHPAESSAESSPQRVMTSAPPKPPRTHAHDDYLRVKVSASQNFDTKSSTDTSHQADVRKTVHVMTSSEEVVAQKETEYTSVKDRITKIQKQTDTVSSELPPLPAVPLADKNAEQNIVRNPAPSRPPPPKRRPNSDDRPSFSSTFSQSSTDKSEEEIGPMIIPVSPQGRTPQKKQPSNTPVLNARRPDDQLPPEPDASKLLQKFPLRKSYSSECLHSSRGSSLNRELHDEDSANGMSRSSYESQYEAVIDPDGYAVPNVFMRLPGKKRLSIKDDNLDVSPGQFLMRLKGYSGDSLSEKGQQSQGTKVVSVQEQSLEKVNKKKMNMVKQKINQAYADVDIAAGGLSEQADDEFQIVNHEPDAGESMVEPTVLKKRIEYCTSVRLKSSKSIRHCKDYLSAVYPQLFEYCLIVSLQPLVDSDGYEPHVLFKFPENFPDFATVSSNLSVPSFCFPDASVFKPGTATSVSESYSFVMTNADGSRVYGYCRRTQPLDSSLPEVTCIISPIDAFNMYTTLLSEVEARRRISFDQATELIAASFGRPLPKPGKVCHIRTLDASGEMETIFLNRSADNRLEHVNYESPLYYLGTDRLVRVFSSMLMERRIILCSSNLSVLTQTVHALSALLYPFQWQHVYIPLLPHEMLDVLCAPVPFIVGVLSVYLPKVLKLDLEEVFIVDLDKKNIVKSLGDEATVLPKRIQKALKTAINMCKIDAEARNVQWLMVAEAFLRMFIETVGHFNNSIRTQQDGNRIFQKEGFIHEVNSKEVREFLSWFTETQMFEVFISNHVERLDYGTSELFLQRLTEFKESKEESSKHKGLGAKVKNFGKALKTKLAS